MNAKTMEIAMNRSKQYAPSGRRQRVIGVAAAIAVTVILFSAVVSMGSLSDGSSSTLAKQPQTAHIAQASTPDRR